MLRNCAEFQLEDVLRRSAAVTVTVTVELTVAHRVSDG
jgi:hypothetical protein